MDSIKYVNLETWQLLTLEQLQADFSGMQKNGEIAEDVLFSEYLNNCMTRYNGTLEEVEKVTDTFYRTKDGSYYSVNGQMVCNDVNSELSDIYYDFEKELDELTFNADTNADHFDVLLNT
jgi:hypothetical protein